MQRRIVLESRIVVGRFESRLLPFSELVVGRLGFVSLLPLLVCLNSPKSDVTALELSSLIEV